MANLVSLNYVNTTLNTTSHQKELGELMGKLVNAVLIPSHNYITVTTQLQTSRHSEPPEM